MPQGKMKVKAKVPHGAKTKNKGISKAKDAQKKNRPAQPKPKKDLMKAAVTKQINESNEAVFKQKATVEGKPFRIIPTDDIQPGTSTAPKNPKLDKGRLPKKK